MTQLLTRARARLEAMVASLGKTTKPTPTTRLQPADLARHLSHAIPTEASPEKRKIANAYTILMHPDDLAGLAGQLPDLERELARYIQQTAEERGLALAGPPSVRLSADPAVARATPYITAAIIQTTPGAARAGQPVPGAHFGFLFRGDPTQPFPFVGTHILIGRASDNDLVLADPKISRYHLELQYGPSGWHVYDLGSSNGTFVNTLPIRDHLLHTGDEVRIGDIALTFTDHAGPW